MNLRSVLLQTSLAATLASAGLLHCPPAWALDPDKKFQHYVLDSWSIQNGLPQISVQAIAQDHQGYIWVGTQSGTARFDGIRFTTFKPETEPAIPGIWTRTLLVDHAGSVWIGTYKGLAVYQNGGFRRIASADAAHFPMLDIFALIEDGNGIIAATGSGIFDVRNGLLVRRQGSPPSAQTLLKRDDGLWVGGPGGVYRLQGTQSHFLPLPIEASTAAVTRLVESQGRIWAGTSAGLYVRVGEQWQAATGQPLLRSSPITMMLEDHDRNLWVGSNAGLARWRDGALAEFVPATSPGAIKSVMSAFEDRENNLWLGSQWDGLTRIWNGWTRRYSVVEGLNDPLVWSLSRAPDGRIWVGTNDGLSVFAGGRFQQVLRGDQLPHPHAYNLLAESDRIWIGTRRGLVIWRNGKLEAPPVFAPMAGAQINGIFRDSHGVVWFPTTNGLYRFADNVLSHYGQAEGLSDLRVRQVRELKDGRLLAGTQDGLYELKGDRLMPLGVDSGLPPGLDVTAIAELRGGEWVIGTLSELLYMFDGHRWQPFGAAQGFPANAPFYITEDDAGFLWAAGIRGIERAQLQSMRHLQRGEIQHAQAEMVLNERGDRLSGQKGFCCNGAGNSKGFIDHGVLWLPSRDGIVSLDTTGVVKNKVAPDVVIERLQYLEQWHATGRQAVVTLPENARDLAFEFTALSFQDPASVVLRYTLRGYDHGWRDLQVVSPRSVNYTNLPPGAYTFEVMASNNANVWNRTPATLNFTIQPHFQETGLFYLLLSGLLATILYAGYRQQRRAHLAKSNELERLVLERTGQLHVANLQLEHASQTDSVTALRNHRYLANQIPVDLAYYEREQARSGSTDSALLFALVEIDHFERLLAEHGARAGDRVLKQFAQAMPRLVRIGDYVVRESHEHFLLVFRPVPRQHLPTIAERIRRCVAEHVFELGDGLPLPLTCSIGLTEYPVIRDARGPVGWEQMLELASAALDWVKAGGGDGWAELRPTRPTELAFLIGQLRTGPQALIDSGRLQVFSSRNTPPPPPGDATSG